jgi:hypothetical protein
LNWTEYFVKFYSVLNEPITGARFNQVVRAECWHPSNPGLNPRQGRPLYIWMYTPSAESILEMDMCSTQKYLFHLISFHFLPNK